MFEEQRAKMMASQAEEKSAKMMQARERHNQDLFEKFHHLENVYKSQL